ncbi:hypothetical protein ABAZ39_17950 (plasmid) [Azospirillum argentinense]|uniref:Uncharacterized protein n=1 Tax=Azospirillum argentinense TaxID=2970906 RepID=A0A5B0KSP3_9PROT|nr:hypothetical protein [Azospirillum argentinense]AIB13823.1 hypothetical protein ABAZ39_17950 [Azospirillum argentinense]EZQ05884.1 hypothetical protein ABAZ39_20170 [Azospirillum argentinense]KAA1054906.1 hypothetical protein FH063_006182 [Azospirillum argentinense]PNR00465.1 hypothetical protein C1S70_03455 [Azospirillum argentinense]
MQIGSYLTEVSRVVAKFTAQNEKTEPEKEASGVSAADAFLKEARKSPAQRIRDQILARMKLDEESLASMPAEKRAAVEKQIAEELKRQLSGEKDRRGAAVDLTA